MEYPIVRPSKPEEYLILTKFEFNVEESHQKKIRKYDVLNFILPLTIIELDINKVARFGL